MARVCKGWGTLVDVHKIATLCQNTWADMIEAPLPSRIEFASKAILGGMWTIVTFAGHLNMGHEAWFKAFEDALLILVRKGSLSKLLGLLSYYNSSTMNKLPLYDSNERIGYGVNGAPYRAVIKQLVEFNQGRSRKTGFGLIFVACVRGYFDIATFLARHYAVDSLTAKEVDEFLKWVCIRSNPGSEHQAIAWLVERYGKNLDPMLYQRVSYRQIMARACDTGCRDAATKSLPSLPVEERIEYDTIYLEKVRARTDTVIADWLAKRIRVAKAGYEDEDAEDMPSYVLDDDYLPRCEACGFDTRISVPHYYWGDPEYPGRLHPDGVCSGRPAEFVMCDD